MIENIPFSSSSLSDQEWDNFVDESDNGTMFHKRKFLSYHPEDRFEDYSFVLKKDGKLLSLFPATMIHRNGKQILSSHPGSSYGGFVYKKELTLKESFGMVQGLLNYAKELNCNAIQLTHPPMIYQTKYSNYIDFALCKNGFSCLKREISSIIQLDVEGDQLLSTFRPEARTAVKKALNQNVVIAETERFDDYYEILKKNLKMRHNVLPTHTLKELLKLKSIFPSEIRLWGAFLKGKLIAGVCNFSTNSRVVLAFYISHIEEYQKYRPINLLFYEIMKHYHNEGFKFLDFGLFTVNMEPNWGLARFKESFGARGILRDTYTIEL